MSSLWTPGGERPVGRDAGQDPATHAPQQELSDEERDQLEQELATMQRQLLETPAHVVVANHAIGLFQLASLHLSQRPPNLDEGRVAIDAMASIVEKLGNRLGDHEKSLRDALSQLRLAFVELKRRAEEGDAQGDPGEGRPGGASTDS